jgi:hypothetical protein
MLVDKDGKPLRSSEATPLHEAAERWEKGQLRAYGVIYVEHDGTVHCNVGRDHTDAPALMLLGQGCGTIIGYLRTENARHHAPDPG